MKRFRVSSILVFSILLIIVAVGLLGTSVYFLLEAKSATTPIHVKTKDNSAANPNNIVSTDPALAIIKPDTVSSLSSDTINSKLNEIYALKKEIPSFINHTNDTDLTVTRERITELLQKIDDLKNRTSKVETENKFLKAMLQELTDELKTKQQNIQRISKDNKTTTITQNTIVAISDIRLAAVNNNDQETNIAEDADKLKGSFLLKRNTSNASFYIVIIQPNGKVLQNSSWEAGAFESTEGRKLYTTKVLFDAANETKRPTFSIAADNLQRGTYLIQVYYNGAVVGKGSRTLL